MEVRSLARRTGLIFSRFEGQVTDKGDCIVIRTPSNPGFHWGNYIVFAQAPCEGDLERWKEVFRAEFSCYDSIQHMTFSWEGDPLVPGAYQQFVDDGFEFQESVVLCCSNLVYPKKHNDECHIRPLDNDHDWDAATQVQLLCGDPKYANAGHEKFKREQMKRYREMSEKGLGHWFGAFLGEKLVADLGVFFDGELGRYQSVGTHPSYRRQGLCQTLVYQAGQFAFEHFGVKTLVMEADVHYHAARIYESVGFVPTEKSYGLSWWTDHS